MLSLSLSFLSVLYCCLVWPLCLALVCVLYMFYLFVVVVWLSVPVQVTDCKDSSPKWPIMIKFIRQMTTVEYKIYTQLNKRKRIKCMSKHCWRVNTVSEWAVVDSRRHWRRLSTTAHSLTVFSLIPVWFVMAILTVVMTGYFYLAMCLLFLLPNNYAVDDF